MMKARRDQVSPVLGIVGARTARLKLAKLALKDEPVRAGVTHAAVPKKESRVALDDLERVVAISGKGHF